MTQPISPDDRCTDCNDTGITTQTERRCACQPVLPISPDEGDALKACSFCGCEQWPICDKHDYWGPDGDHRNGCPMGSYDLCEFADKSAMIAAWNTRTAPPIAIDDELARLKGSSK